MSRYLYQTPTGETPNNGMPPGMEPPILFGPFGPMPFGPPFGCGFNQFSPFGPVGGMMGPSPFGPSFGCQMGPPLTFWGGGTHPPPYTAKPPCPQEACCSQKPAQTREAPPGYTPGDSRQPPTCNAAPPSGSRVNGFRARFRNGSSHIFPKDNTSFRIVKGGSKPWEQANIAFDYENFTCGSYMPVEEFIDQIDAHEKAPRGTPKDDVGITEIIQQGSGRWVKGPTYRHGDYWSLNQELANGLHAPKTLSDIGMGAHRGRANPIYIVVEPCGWVRGA